MPSSLEQLKSFTTVVADTGDFELIAKYTPQDSTTNPSLIYAASMIEKYQPLVEAAINKAKNTEGTIDEKADIALDQLAVNFGVEILKIIPGRVSTEIDARLSFDTDATVKKARKIIELYKEAGVDKDRILLKIASTWEGLQAAKTLEAEGLHCNLTLMFSLIQAAVAAENGITLISPFAGRITDFFKAKQGVDGFPPKEDPGVVSVGKIYNYYKQHGHKTVVMGASFRSKEQVIELAGCDFLTISPTLLEQLANADVEVVRNLDPSTTGEAIAKLDTSEANFRWEMNEDEMAHFKTAEGIRKFSIDLVKLEASVREKLLA
eukprot:TRINITY_DN1118_c0_g1_i2.p1 TRINITY_DN1118_c0_g1~~TRINITY_DN1118_c0_g1_i2.p1  ORF type:complete len:335 (-),score=133.15 TRINITY_DN1118_c0_g1_i2:293-1255(-)